MREQHPSNTSSDRLLDNRVGSFVGLGSKIQDRWFRGGVAAEGEGTGTHKA